jgi:hypothetical protein
MREDLESITSILYQVFEIPSFKRNYDAAFGRVADILRRYGIVENPNRRKNHSALTCLYF